MKHTYLATKTNPTTLIVHCSDPRFQPAFNCFSNRELNTTQDQAVPIIIAGGPASLANPIMAKEKQFLSGQIVFLLKHFPSINMLALINHEDCGFYKQIPNPEERINREKEDMPTVARAITGRIASEEIKGVEVAAFYAGFADTDRNKIVFEKIQAAE